MMKIVPHNSSFDKRMWWYRNKTPPSKALSILYMQPFVCGGKKRSFRRMLGTETRPLLHKNVIYYFNVINDLNCWYTSFSKSLATTEITDIGLQFPQSALFPSLKTGVTFAGFQSSGKIFLWKDTLKMLTNGPAMILVASFSNLVLNLSSPGDLLDLIWFSASLLFGITKLCFKVFFFSFFYETI